MELSGQLLLAHAGSSAQALTEGVEPGHLPTAQRRLLDRTSSAQSPVERGVGLESTGKVEHARDPRERTALIPKEQGLFVAMHVVGHARRAVVPGGARFARP
jgi:hypothetical protein